MLGRGSFTALTEAERGEEWLFSFRIHDSTCLAWPLSRISRAVAVLV